MSHTISPDRTVETIAPSVLDAIRKLDTCTVSNAIERFQVRLRNEGFTHGAVHCRFPDLPPMLGYAVTARIRCTTAPLAGKCYWDRMDWWNHVLTVHEPRVIVLQDIDHHPGVGAFVGEVHSHIAMALGCVGCVTNGAVRDLRAVSKIGFHMFSGSVTVSHAYAHIIEFGDTVEIGSLRVHHGELVHGDCNGVHTIPTAIASQIPAVASRIQAQEQELISYCKSERFSMEGLEHKLRHANPLPGPHHENL